MSTLTEENSWLRLFPNVQGVDKKKFQNIVKQIGHSLSFLFLIKSKK